MSSTQRSLLGVGAAILWVLLCVRWFDPGEAFRPAWFEAVPPWLLCGATLGLAVAWLQGRWPLLWGAPGGSAERGLWLVVFLALAFRLPMVWQGAAGYVTSDGAGQGILAIRLREGIDHLVFLPPLPYNGTLKAHLTAVLSLFTDTPRAFALASVLLYCLFVAALYRLALLALVETDRVSPSVGAMTAGLYAAFAPAYITHYSLSNDGNYVDTLAFGTWALLLAARWAADHEQRTPQALLGGLLLGVAFWCHILGIMYAVAFGLFLVWADRRAALRSVPVAISGFALGYMPGLLWNAVHGWASFLYVIPGGQPVAGVENAPALSKRLWVLVTDQWPVMMGYDLGYPPAIDALFRGLAALAVVASLVAVGLAVRAAWSRRPDALWLLLIFLAVNSLIALVALPQLPANPRYLIFLATPVPILLVRAWGAGWRRWVLGLLIAFGAIGSLAQWPSAARSDRRWRSFVEDLRQEGVRFCYTDFWIAVKLSFLAEEQIICCAKLGPSTSESFFEHRLAVEQARTAAYIAVNGTNAGKLERKLARLGVTHDRVDLMKPVLLRLSRKVDPEELFPGREFPLR